MDIGNRQVVVSVFYNKALYHELINHAVAPFLQAEGSSIKNCVIYLSSNQGEHISLSIEPTDDIEVFKLKVLRHFKEYLKNNQSVTAPVQYPLDDLFDIYPNNSIHFNIEKLSISTDREVSNIVSKAIINGLAVSEIDSDSIFSFLVCIHMGLLKVIYNSLARVYEGIDELNGCIVSDVNPTEVYDYMRLYEDISIENNKFLEDISKEVWHFNVADCGLDWLKSWILECSSLLTHYNSPKRYIAISCLVFRHLGLDCKNLLPLILDMCRAGLKNITYTKSL